MQIRSDNQFSSIQFSHSVMSDSATPWITARQASLSITPRVYPNSCPLSQWCHPSISSSVSPFSSHLQSFPTSGSFQMSQFFASGGQSIGVSASLLPMNIQDWFPLGGTGWISLLSKMGPLQSCHQLANPSSPSLLSPATRTRERKGADITGFCLRMEWLQG